MTSNAELIAQIEQIGEEYARFVETLSDEQFHRRPDPNEWSAAEITGHVSEAPLTFANHARRLADRGPKEGAELVRDGVRDACAVLRTIPEDGWSVMGEHSRLGPKSVRELVESSVLCHLRGHLRQAREAAGVA